MKITNPNTKVVFVRKGEKYSPEKAEIRGKLNDFFSIIQNAHYSYEIWWILISKDGKGKYFNAYLHFKEFFEPVAYSNLTSMIIALYKLYENRRDTLNFEKLYNKVDKLELLDKNSKNNFMKRQKECKNIWKKVTIIRSNLLAHRNYKLTRNQIYKKAKLSPNQMKRLIELSLKNFNALWLKVEKYPKKLDNFTNRDTLQVLKALKNNMHR